MSGIGGVGGASSYQAIMQQAAARRAQQGPTGKQGAQQISKTNDPFSKLGIEQAGKPDAGKVAGSVDTALQQVSGFQHNADQMVIDLATGQDTNIHNTMVELEKADIALKYTVQLRNRALNAYEELMRIQI
jgi:flagellar hook-basal body complex protein FliE